MKPCPSVAQLAEGLVEARMSVKSRLSDRHRRLITWEDAPVVLDHLHIELGEQPVGTGFKLPLSLSS